MVKLIFILLSVLFMHPSQVCLTNIEYNQTNKTFGVSFKFDRGSFNFVFLHNYLYSLKMDSVSIEPKSLNLINGYITNHFSLETRKQRVQLAFTGHKLDVNELWLNYSAKINFDPDTISVRNLLLTDYDVNQTNVVIFKTNSIEKGFILNKDDYKINLALKGLE